MRTLLLTQSSVDTDFLLVLRTLAISSGEMAFVREEGREHHVCFKLSFDDQTDVNLGNVGSYVNEHVAFT